jgi:predicted ATPase
MNFIEGFAISNYRSFGAELQKIGPCSNINIIIGKNNSGKSNILRFLWQYDEELNKYFTLQKDFTYKNSDDVHLGLTRDNIAFGIGVDIKNPEKRQRYYESLLTRGVSKNSTNVLEIILSNISEENMGILWMLFTGITRNSVSKETADLLNMLSENLKIASFEKLSSELCRRPGGVRVAQLIEILRRVALDFNNIDNVSMVSAIRQIIKSDTIDFPEFNGTGLITELAKLQDPEHREMEKHDQFISIQNFLQDITNAPHAKINVPYSREYIQVDMTGEGNFLPLESLGTGIHEAVILAAACTIFSEQIVCIEEPELHLHPLLQKKFLQYIAKNTDNQYFISTHSAHLLDTPGASIFHVTLENGESKVSPAYEISEKSSICTDLGYRPSDLFQTNCIIWVEGPSDRIYLKYWIEGKDPELEESLHYSIMFYGGRLLSHLSSEDNPLIDDFISLRKLNRRIMIIMDSDKKKSPHEHINKTKKRIKDEFESNGEFVWVTKGREIENYLDEGILFTAISSVHPKSNVVELLGSGNFGCLIKFKNSKGEEKEIDKLRVAKEYVELENTPNYSKLDLGTKIEEVIKFIKDSNNI